MQKLQQVLGTDMYFTEETHTAVDFSPKDHPITEESITIKRELDDFDNWKTENEADRDLDHKSTLKIDRHIRSGEENKKTTHTEVKFSLKEHPFNGEGITVKREQDDFDKRGTANEVDRDLDQKTTIKSEEENIVNSQYLISHEEVNLKSEDDVEQSDSWFANGKAGHKLEDQIKIFKCPDCPYQSKRKSHLKEHAFVHNKTGQFETFKCAHCAYETPRKMNLKQHLLVHRGKHTLLVHCPEPECPYNTYDKANLKRHSLVHSDERFFKCTQCPYRGKHRYGLKQHQLKHESIDKWHACSQCPYKTIRKGNLKEHVQRHVNPGQLEWYMCEQCPFKTYRKYSFKEHAFTHNKDHAKWLQCTYCPFKTLRAYDFKRHQTSHKDDDSPDWHKCPECPYKAIYKASLLKHAKSHKAADQTDWLQCPECSYRTPRTSNLTTHQMLHNGVAE